MDQNLDSPGTPQLDFEEWRESLRSMCGRYNPEGVEAGAFSGWVRPLNACGFGGLTIGSNAQRIERTDRDARLDGSDHYFVLFQVAGESAMTHNDQAVRLSAGDVTLVDTARSIAYFARNGSEAWNAVVLDLPRQSLVSHLGFDPKGGTFGRRGTSAGRLLHDLAIGAYGNEGSASADSFMQLAVYDLVGALFAPSEPSPASPHTDKLFARLRRLIQDGFVDPDFGPVEVAAAAGISLRYVQKLFTERGSTCSEFIYSRRLDHAARLLHRRALLRTGQPLSEIAYACGFRDYTHFARRFHQRFGHPPGGHVPGGTYAPGR